MTVEEQTFISIRDEIKLLQEGGFFYETTAGEKFAFSIEAAFDFSHDIMFVAKWVAKLDRESEQWKAWAPPGTTLVLPVVITDTSASADTSRNDGFSIEYHYVRDMGIFRANFYYAPHFPLDEKTVFGIKDGKLALSETDILELTFTDHELALLGAWPAHNGAMVTLRDYLRSDSSEVLHSILQTISGGKGWVWPCHREELPRVIVAVQEAGECGKFAWYLVQKLQAQLRTAGT